MKNFDEAKSEIGLQTVNQIGLLMRILNEENVVYTSIALSDENMTKETCKQGKKMLLVLLLLRKTK